MAQNRHPRLAYFGQVMAISDQNHTGHAARGSGINADDLAMRDRAAPVHDMGHAGHFNVVNVGALTLHQFAGTGAFNALANVAGVLGQCMQRLFFMADFGGILHFGPSVYQHVLCGGVHALTFSDGRLDAFLARSARVSQMASTMAW